MTAFKNALMLMIAMMVLLPGLCLAADGLRGGAGAVPSALLDQNVSQTTTAMASSILDWTEEVAGVLEERHGGSDGFLGEAAQPNNGTSNANATALQCQNQAEHVSVIGKNDKTNHVNCEEHPSEEMDQLYCRQFDHVTRLPVWHICPLACSMSRCHDESCNKNTKDKLKVLDDKSKWKTIKCSKPGKNSEYCRQFDANSRLQVWKVCPGMCPDLSGCDYVY